MTPLKRGLGLILRPTRKFVYVLVVSMFALQVIVVFAQVIYRFVFNSPFSWSEELARYLQVWIVFLASSVCIREGTHLAVDYLLHHLPVRYKKTLATFSAVSMSIFVCILIVAGIKMIVTAQSQATPALHIPMGAVYLVFPVGGTLLLLESVNILLETLSGSDRAVRKGV